MSTLRLRLIRLLTEHDLTLDTLAMLVNRQQSHIKVILDEWETSGYAARLDHGFYTLTK